jgi:5-methyltetrahydrofolate--homocysteine methyltransferase
VNRSLLELTRCGPVLTDGAWGTQLQQRGLPIGGCPDAWNLTHPDRVAEVAAAYVAAGSRVILTNTFGANRLTLSRHGLAEQAAQINRLGAQISCQAAGDRAHVFGSIGPSGRMLATGEVTASELQSAFEEQAQALQEGGVQALVVETMSDLDEARIAVEAARSTGLPVVASMTFGVGKQGDRTIMGVTPERAAAVLSEAGAGAVGTNCGIGPEAMIALCARLRAATDLPVWVKPNAGLPVMEDGRAVYQTTPEAFADIACQFIGAGANFIGGCCGTGPEFITALAERMR